MTPANKGYESYDMGGDESDREPVERTGHNKGYVPCPLKRRPINHVVQTIVGRFGRYRWFRTTWLKRASDLDHRDA